MKKSVLILLHAAYWMMYILLIVVFLLALPQGYKNQSLKMLGNILFLSRLTLFCILPALLGFYIFYGVLFPAYLSRNKLRALVVSAIFVSLICGIVPSIILTILMGHAWFDHNNWASVAGVVVFMSILALIHGIIGLVIRGFVAWFGDIKLKEALNKKNYEVELALVKSQINPHFLFNTINNIDVLIEKDATKASAYLNKLSDIMRYMLYETKADQVSLEKELAYIEKYIELQKIRTANPEFVYYQVVGAAGMHLVQPMLFIPFIENAFKHAENKKNGNVINIKFVITEKNIRFFCTNLFHVKTKPTAAYAGLGNELAKKRLALLYPGKHELEVDVADGLYSIKLILER